MSKKTVPEGTKDLIVEEAFIKNKLIADVTNAFSNWGYEEVVTPTVEFYSTFEGEEGLKEEEMYKFFDNEGKILTLRSDMTIPIARLVSTKLKEHEAPIRLSYKSNVYRVNEVLAGKKNEYTDCGIELVGLDYRKGDLEALIVALEAMKVTSVKDYKIEIGDINFFNNAVAELNADNKVKEKIASLINKKAIPELNSFINSLDAREEVKEMFKKLPMLFGDYEILESIEKLSFNDGMRESVEYLKSLYNDLKYLGYEDYVTFDLGMIPKINYYSGIIFRGYALGSGVEVLSGGRYDNLLGKFGRDEKAVGFSINIDELIKAVGENVEYDEVFYEVFHNEKDKLKAIIKARHYIKGNKKVILKCDNNFDEIIIKVRKN